VPFALVTHAAHAAREVAVLWTVLEHALLDADFPLRSLQVAVAVQRTANLQHQHHTIHVVLHRHTLLDEVKRIQGAQVALETTETRRTQRVQVGVLVHESLHVLVAQCLIAQQYEERVVEVVHPFDVFECLRATVEPVFGGNVASSGNRVTVQYALVGQVNLARPHFSCWS